MKVRMLLEQQHGRICTHLNLGKRKTFSNTHNLKVAETSNLSSHPVKSENQLFNTNIPEG